MKLLETRSSKSRDIYVVYIGSGMMRDWFEKPREKFRKNAGLEEADAEVKYGNPVPSHEPHFNLGIVS